jgi:hypothetical protein
MDEPPQSEATAPEASSPVASGDQDEPAISEPVDTPAGSAGDLQKQQEEGEGGEEEIQPAATSSDDQVNEATEQPPQEIEEAGTGAGIEQAAEQEEAANKKEEEGAAAMAGGEGSKTSFSLRNPKSAMVVLILLEGDEISLEKRVSERGHCLLTVGGRVGV